MKVLSIINLKGGVAKTISSVNMAHILANQIWWGLSDNEKLPFLRTKRKQNYEPSQLRPQRNSRGNDTAGH